MGWLTKCIVVFFLSGAIAVQNIPLGVGIIQNDPLLNQETGENFAKVFTDALVGCGSFNQKEADDFKSIILLLSSSFGSFPKLQKAPPAVLRASAAGFAAAIADRTVKYIRKGSGARKISCVMKALKKAFVVTTGVSNPYFMREVQSLIQVFTLSHGFEGHRGAKPRRRIHPYYNAVHSMDMNQADY